MFVINSFYTGLEGIDGAGSKFKLFLSFKWGEGDYLVDYLLKCLKAKGVDAWKVDHEIKPGQSIPDKIKEGVEPCSLFVCLMSPSYFESGWCKGELEMANAKGKPLFPIQWKDHNFKYPADTLEKYPNLVDPKGLDNNRIPNQNPLRHLYDENAINIEAEKKRCVSKIIERVKELQNEVAKQ